jgi:hypothetical protein
VVPDVLKENIFPKKKTFFWDLLTPDDEDSMFLGNVTGRLTQCHAVIPRNT